MQEFKYSNGRIAGYTMTVGELIAKLNAYPSNMPVFGTWEGVDGYIQEENFSVVKTSKGKEVMDCLLIDVERY